MSEGRFGLAGRAKEGMRFKHAMRQRRHSVLPVIIIIIIIIIYQRFSFSALKETKKVVREAW